MVTEDHRAGFGIVSRNRRQACSGVSPKSSAWNGLLGNGSGTTLPEGYVFSDSFALTSADPTDGATKVDRSASRRSQ